MDGGWQSLADERANPWSLVADNDLEPRSRVEGCKEPKGTGAATSASLPWPLLQAKRAAEERGNQVGSQ